MKTKPVTLAPSHVTLDQYARAQEATPKTVPELLKAMKLTEEQPAKFETQDEVRKTVQAN